MSSDERPPIGLGEHLLTAAQRDRSWLVRLHDDTEQSLTTRQIVEAYNVRAIEPETYVWSEGMANWQQLQAVDALVDALHTEAERAAREDAGDPRRADDQGLPGTDGGGDSAPHEDSAIFSLAMLVSDHQTAEASEARGEDSGLIDLTAMIDSMAPPTGEASNDLQPGGGLFQVQPAVASRATPSAMVPPAPRKNRGLIIGLTAAVTLLSAALVFQIVRTQGTAPTPVASATLTTAAKVAINDATPPAATPDKPVAPESATDAPAAPATSATTGPSSPPTPTSRATTHATQRRVNPPPAPTPAKTSKTVPRGCPCPPDDLMCQMRCATNR